MNILNIVNWIGITLLAIYVALMLVATTKSYDAAGRGMALGLFLFSAIALVVLIGLNLLPFRWSKITTLILLLVPFLVILLDKGWTTIQPLVVRSPYEGQEDGSFWFQDAQRRLLAKAIAAGKVDDLRGLLRDPVPLLNDHQNEDRLSLLDFAAIHASYPSHGNTENMLACMELLLDAGARIADTGRVATHARILPNCKPTVLAFLLEKGADPNALDREGNPILFQAIRAGGGSEALEKVNLLLEKGANPNALYAQSDENQHASPLLFAASFYAWEIGLALLEKGADPNYRTPQGLSIQDYTARIKTELQEQGASLPPAFLILREKINATQ